jgi:predicted  nucleic acid-binding Zn-ribbon protein
MMRALCACSDIRLRRPTQIDEPEEISMTRSVSHVLPVALCAGLLMALSPLGAMAQAKAKKAADGGGADKTISGGPTKGKSLTFKELEACLKEQDALKTRPPELQKQRDAMEAERQAILKEGAAIKADSEELTKLSARVQAFNARMREQGEKVKGWKDRDEAFAMTNRSGPSADRQRKDLELERQALQVNETALDKEAKELEAERSKLAAGFSERAGAQEKAAVDWNARSKLLDKAYQAYEDDRLDWKARCADRSYREEWEKMIRDGK